MADSIDFLPTASLDVLKLRAGLLDWLRTFFRNRGYWEVQTPVLSHDVCVDAWLEPYAVPLSNDPRDQCRPVYLQTSPEFAMKRLLAAGADAIYQIGPAFRQGEVAERHNSEFTIVEWYRVGDTYHDQMTFTEELTSGFLTAAAALCGESHFDHPSSWNQAVLSLPRPVPRRTYEGMFQQSLGENVLTASIEQLQQLVTRHEISAPVSLRQDDRDGWLNLLLAEVVEPELAREPAVFLYDYPATQAALARIRHDTPPVAERFELYLSGIEICNGYQELTDAVELKERFARQSRIRQEAGLPELPLDSRLLEAMEAGLPECSGVALGFDRLMMSALGAPAIQDVIAFPFDRA